jgi:hypothetical protein
MLPVRVEVRRAGLISRAEVGHVLMMCIRVLSAVALVAGILLTHGAADAQENFGPAAPQASAVSVRTTSTPTELQAGTVRAVLMATPAAGRYSAGTSAFAQIRLSSQSTAKRGAAAELLLEVEHGEIVGVTGSGLDRDEERGVQIVHVDGLRKGRDRSLLVEVKLRTAEGNPPNTLKLTLRTPGAEQDEEGGKQAAPGSASAQDTALLAWPVMDCAGRYHAALRQIGAEKGNRLRDIWRAASRPEKSRPREWLFRPALPRQTASRRRAAPEVTASIAVKDGREIFVEAGRMLRAGYDPALGLNGRYSFTLGKTSNDLRKYFSQDENAAICTGAVAFASYYEAKLSPLHKRGERLTALSAEARQLAHERADAIFDAARGLPMGHPGWGGATLASLRPIEDRSHDLQATIADLVEVAGASEAFVAELRGAEGAYAALRALEDRGLEDTELPKEMRVNLRQALSAIEAAVLLDSFVARYAGFWSGFYGSLEAIRDAHGQHCVCDG